MYDYIVTISAYRQQGQRKQASRLLWGLLVALCMHFFFIGIATPIEKHDRPPVHRVSPMDIEMIVSPTPVKQVVKQALPRKKRVTQAKIKPMPVKKAKPVIDKKTVLVHHPIKKPKVQKNKPLQPTVQNIVQAKEQQSSKTVVHTTASPSMPKEPVHLVSHQTTIKSEALRSRYISHVMHLIKTHKLYPYSARRRHLESDILISFIIDSNGKLMNIQISGKHSVLRHASREAIEAAQPFPLAPEGTGSMIQMTFIMQYRLMR